MPSDKFKETLAVWKLFYKTVSANPSIDLAPWCAALEQEECYALAAVSSRERDNPAALRIVSACAMLPEFGDRLLSFEAVPERLGLSRNLVGENLFTALDVAAYFRNEGAFGVLLRSLGKNQDDATRKRPWQQSVTERTICFLCYGDGRTTRPAGPIVDELVKFGCALPLKDFSCAAELPDDSVTRRDIYLARARSENDGLDEMLPEGKEGGKPTPL